MNESELREALLRQEGSASIQQELSLLRGLIESEQRRTTRLAYWTLCAWTGWGACLALMILLPHWMARKAIPAGQPPMPVNPPGALLYFVMNLLSYVLITGAVVLPVVGLVLLIQYIFGRRSAMARNWFARPLK